jgi:hypothetical protein
MEEHEQTAWAGVQWSEDWNHERRRSMPYRTNRRGIGLTSNRTELENVRVTVCRRRSLVTMGDRVATRCET